jgi:tetratricopeptide (TPR) repeat protein
LRRTAERLVKEKHPAAVLLLAGQCWQLGDQSLAQHLHGVALRHLPENKEPQSLEWADLEFLWQTGQLVEADKRLDGLLAKVETAKRAPLWRLAAKLASRRDNPARELECLEHALDAEYRHLPEVVNLQAVRADYERLLNNYQEQARALKSLRLPTPGDFREKVIRTADRWRALDRDAGRPCELAARILQTIGERDEVWDYLTTPVALHPNEAEPWANLGQTLARQGEWQLADRAYAAAFEAEPTNAQLLWDRARNLAQAGQAQEAEKLYRRLAEGTWQPRFAGLRDQARWQLEKQR